MRLLHAALTTWGGGTLLPFARCFTDRTGARDLKGRHFQSPGPQPRDVHPHTKRPEGTQP